jgi:PAS domain S-box-containing protein
MVIFFAISLVSWLSARSLEHALRDLRIINRELDQRVDERTRDLAEALSRNQAVLEGIADGVIVFNRRGEAMIVNPAMTRLIHRPANEIIGYDIDVLMAEEVADTDREAVGGLLRDQESSYPGLKFEWGDKTFSVSLAPVRDNFRRVTGTVAVFRDFTREAEIDRMKSAFVSMVSHELRTPLNAVLGYAEILREALYGPLSDKQLNAVNRIIANTDQLLNIVSNLLDQAQIESGRLTLNVTPFAPAHLIDEVVGGMNVLAQTKDLVVRQEIAGDVPARLFGDRQRLHQVLVNLMGNAIKFTDEGEVGVRAYRSDGNCWALEVWDTGCGIPEEAHEYIFDAFRRADDSLTRKYAGTGLGLSIVKQLVNLMEGDILLDSEVGQGSTFTVVLPLISEGGA